MIPASDNPEDLTSYIAGHELRRQRPAVESESKRSPPLLGNERRTATRHPRLPPPRDGHGLHRRQRRQMALPRQSHREPQSGSGAEQGIPLLQPTGRQAQPASHRRDPDPRDARQLRHHVALANPSRHPHWQNHLQRLGVLRRGTLARTRRTLRRRRLQLVCRPTREPLL